jgi:membrane protein
VRLFRVTREVYRGTREDDVPGLAAELAYRFLFALFPLFILIAALGGFVADLLPAQDPTARIMDTLGDALPAEAAGMLETQLDRVLGGRHPALLSIGVIAALWASAGAMNAIMKALNRIYGVEEKRPLWRRYALSIGLTLLAGGGVVVAFVVLLVGQVWGMQIGEALGLGPAVALAINLARWPLVIGLLVVAMAVLYWAAPNMNLPFRWISAGAVTFTLGWVAVSYLFGLYVANFGNYSDTYGALGGVIILMVWFYLSAFVLLVGAELNALMYARAEPGEASERLRDRRARAGLESGNGLGPGPDGHGRSVPSEPERSVRL